MIKNYFHFSSRCQNASQCHQQQTFSGFNIQHAISSLMVQSNSIHLLVCFQKMLLALLNHCTGKACPCIGLIHSDMMFFFRSNGALSSGVLPCSLFLVFLSYALKLASKPSRDLGIKSLYSLITLPWELNLCLELTTSNISLLSRYSFLQFWRKSLMWYKESCDL